MRTWTIAATLTSVTALLLTAVPAHAAKPPRARIAYVGIYPNVGIYSVDLFGGHRLRLTPKGVAAARPTWTPSGNQVTYLVNSAGEGYRTVRSMRANGSGKRTLLSGGRFRHFFDLAWAPQGRRMAVTMENSAATVHDVAIYTPKSRKLVRLHLFDGTRWIPTNIDWSHDGRRLVFSAYRISQSNPHELDGSELWTVRPNGAGLRRLTNTPRYEFSPVWAPRDKRLAFDVGLNCGAVVIANPDGTLRRRLPADCAGRPDWSPDGDRLVVRIGEEIALIRTDGTGRKALAHGYDPAWRPR